MKTIACLTLGCKVNQYDTEAMREAFERLGYESVPFDGPADAYLINTCTVTGTGDQKSMKLIRRIAREHPEAGIIVAGCLAQRDAEKVRLPGVRLIVRTPDRSAPRGPYPRRDEDSGGLRQPLRVLCDPVGARAGALDAAS